VAWDVPGEVGQLRNAGLHLEGHLILGDPGGDLGVVVLLSEDAVHALDLLDDLTLGALANAFGIADVVNGIAFGLKLDALETARQDAAAPLPRGDRLLTRLPAEVSTMKPGRFCGTDPEP